MRVLDFACDSVCLFVSQCEWGYVVLCLRSLVCSRVGVCFIERERVSVSMCVCE